MTHAIARIEDAKRVVNAVTANGHRIEVAFWKFLEPIGEWRLFIASSELPEIGPRALIECLSDTIQSMAVSFELFDVEVRGLRDSDILEFVSQTEPLGAEFERVWNENVGELYEP